MPILAGTGSLHASLAKNKKKENRNLSVMVFMGRGTNESNKKHKGKLTLELEQSDPAKCKVSLYPQRISALKKANPPLHPFLSMFLWNHKVYFQS